MSAPASGTSPSWKQRARLVIGLARWDAAATLSSRWLWMARYCVPGLFVTAFAAFILFETWDPKVEASTRESAEVLGKTLIHAAFAFAAIGIPWLVYMRFTEARRTGMLEALLLSPMSRSGVILHQVIGRLWAGAYCLLAAAPAFALAAILGGYSSGELTRAVIVVPAAACCAAGFATLLAVRGTSFEGFIFRYAFCLVFAPASMRPRVWVPCVLLYIWLGAFSPFIELRWWNSGALQDAALGLGMPFQALASSLADGSSSHIFLWGLCGALLWGVADLAMALHAFSRGSFALSDIPKQSSLYHPLQRGDMPAEAKNGIWKPGYARNPLVRLLLARHGNQGFQPGITMGFYAIPLLTLIVTLLGLGNEWLRNVLEALLMAQALVAGYLASSILGGASCNTREELLSTPLNGRDVIEGAAVACLPLSGTVLFPAYMQSVAHRSLAAFPCFLTCAFGALLLALAIGVWLSPARGTQRAKTLAGFIFFFGVYRFLGLAVTGRSEPFHFLFLGAVLQVMGLVLLAAFPFFFRRLTRVSVSVTP